ncbi:hypothetical protein KKG77_02075, partial [bacterium]|nr:hypothetical protein [bacterium]
SSHQIKINDEINLFNADYISLDKQAFFENILSCRVSNMACGRLYKRELFTKYNCFFPKGAFYEDVATLYKLAFYAKTVVYIDEPLYIYHSMREGSISASFDIKKVNDLFKALESTQSFLISQDIYKKYLGLYVERFAKQIFSKFNRIEDQGLKDIVIQKIVDLDIFNDMNLNAVAKTDYMTYSLIQVFIIENIYKHDSDLKADLFKKLFFDASKKCVFKAINRESLGHENLKNKYNSENCFIFSKPFVFDAQTKVQFEQVYTFGIHEAIFSNFVTNFYFSIGVNFTIKNSDRIKKYNSEVKLLPSFANNLYEDEGNCHFFNDYEKHVSSMSSKKYFEFSYNPFEYLDASFGSIIAGLQMAYYLGFKRVYLVDIHFNTQESRMVYSEIEQIYQQSNREILLLDATDVVHSIL